MAGLAQILKESGHDVSGADAKFYPPMSDYLKKIGIKTIEGYEKKSLPEADLYVIGNALSRGNECVEEILDQKLPYVSGPEMLGKELKNRNVFAISGTHGKTTTSYMLAHIFLDQGREIGYILTGTADGYIPNDTMVWGAQLYKGHVFYSDFNTGIGVAKVSDLKPNNSMTNQYVD